MYNISVTISWAKCEIYIHIYIYTFFQCRPVDFARLTGTNSPLLPLYSLYIYIYTVCCVQMVFYIVLKSDSRLQVITGYCNLCYAFGTASGHVKPALLACLLQNLLLNKNKKKPRTPSTFPYFFFL